MISKECFVYLQLPHSHDLLTVGRLQWKKEGAKTEVSTFVYGKSYLKNANAFSLDPFELPLIERPFQTTKNEGLHGPLRDASPDSWGRYVIEKNTPPSEHDPIGYLLNSANDRIGALSFGRGKSPPAPEKKFNRTMDLSKLINAAHKLEQDLPLDETEKALLMVGPSAGGARPKATIEHQGHLWIAKFASVNDKHNFARIEYATLKLASKCGLRVPEVQIQKINEKDVFLIQRFDREPNLHSYFRTHFVSGLTLLNLDETDYASWSYLDLAEQMRRWIKKPKKDLHEMFARICFNGLISNTDDHPRNHGFLYLGDGYGLSPAYDLVPKPEVATDRYLAMEIGNKGRIFNLENLLSRCEAFDLTKKAASEIFSAIKGKIAKWPSHFANHGVSKTDMKFLESAFHHLPH